ncbi:unnamed protein product [Lactuca saligna]|uniref:Uncharacterized protein n=1 Tax=Lactuca saligna TaxID=75948 RepID=A0AA35ZMF9_LACSI|nr:unnamed protein product [Lactuca saligna]
MYRPSPVRNPRAKGIKSKNVLQICLLLAVCFWLIFQVKRSHEKKKEFDNTKISLSTSKQSNNEIAKLGRKDLQPKLEKIEAEAETQIEQDEEKIDEGKEDEIDENEQEKSEAEENQEIEEVIDEESQSQTETETETGDSVEDHEDEEEEENGGSTHTHEGREEHYKADDASSAVVTHLSTENTTNEEISNGETFNNGTSLIDPHENGPPSSTKIMDSDSTEAVNVTVEGFAPNSSYVKNDELKSRNEVESDEDEGESENLEGNDVILDPDEVENETHLEEKEVRMDLDTLPEIETEGGNSEDTAAERR